MKFELATTAPALDRRVRRSRSALMRAAISLVAERGTTAVSLSEIAEAADVSRQVVYLQFGDRDSLLLEAALDLARRELLPHTSDVSLALHTPHGPTGRGLALTMARHFAEHRAFYRALLTGSCAYPLNKALTGLLIPINRQVVHQMYGDGLDPHTDADLAAYLTGGAGAFFNTWVVEGDDPLDPEEFTDRLLRLMSALTRGRRSTATTPDQEDAQ